MAVTHEQASTSLEYIRAPVSGTENGLSADLSQTTVAVTFVQEGSDPPTAAGTWYTAQWETDATTTPDTYYARALVGPSPGVVALTPGIWDMYIKVTDAPEVAILQADGEIRIY